MKNFLITILYLATANLLASEVTLDDEMWHDMGSKYKTGYEWYYFDVDNHDGGQISFIMFGPNQFDPKYTKHLFRDPKNHVGTIAQIYLPEGKQFDVKSYLHNKKSLKFQKTPFEFSIKENSIKRSVQANGLPNYLLTINSYDKDKNIGIKGRLNFQSVQKGWMFKDGYTFKRKTLFKNIFHRWFVVIPRANVTGSYTITYSDGSKRKVNVNGIGYHDHNYGSAPFNLHLKSWYWGRAYTKDKTLIYAKFIPQTPNLFGIKPETLLYFADARKVYLGTDSAEIEMGKKSDYIVAENGIRIPKDISIKSSDQFGRQYRFEFRKKDYAINSIHPFYYRYATEVEINCPISLVCADRSTALSEKINLNKLMPWIIKEIF
jgi:hypothetical protein